VTNEEKQCKETEHNFIKIAEEQREGIDSNWNAYYYKAYIMCCSKCGKTMTIHGGWKR
jgi:hypothetical protein